MQYEDEAKDILNYSGDSSSDKNTTVTNDPDKQTQDTGIEGVGVVMGVAAVAIGIIAVSKKRK